MYVYKKLVCDENTIKNKGKILRKIKYHGGLTTTYVIALATSNDLFDLIPGYVFKQKVYPVKDLYVMGLADSYDSALELTTKMVERFSKIYGTYSFKENLLEEVEENFKKYGK